MNGGMKGCARGWGGVGGKDDRRNGIIVNKFRVYTNESDAHLGEHHQLMYII